MKKILMTAALLAVGATAFGASAPVSVSLDVVQTSQLVLMDGTTQLTQIDLKHPQILLSTAKGTTSSSVVSKTFTAQTGDGTPIQVSGANAAKITYTLEGVGTAGELKLMSGTSELASTLSLARAEDALTGGATSGSANTITSTIAPNALNGLTVTGTYTGAATLKVVAAS